MSEDAMFFALLGGFAVWCMFAGVGWYIAVQKGRPALEGALFGFFLGPIGFIIEACMPTIATPQSAIKQAREDGVDDVDNPVELERWLKRGGR